MIYLGLPSTLTPGRIKDVLGLAKSHERDLREALDASASPAWTRIGPDDDLYERLRALFTTVEGRKAYEEARSVFEGAKTKRFRRADFLHRLVENCRKEALGQSGAMGYASVSDQDLIERLAQDSAWAHVAEVAWATDLMSGDASRVVDVIDAYPETRPYLEDVQAGPIQIEDDEDPPLPEEDGEAVERVGYIRRVVETLDADRLKEEELLSLVGAAQRLVEIAKARNIRDRDVSSQKTQIENWEAQRAEAVAGAAVVVEALAALKAQVAKGGMGRRGVDAALDLAERLLSNEVRYQETHEKLKQASNEAEADVASVHSLADALGSFRAEREETRAAIERALAEPRSDDPGPENRAEPSDPDPVEREADPETPRRPSSEPAPGAVAQVEDVPEPSAGEDPAPDDGDGPDTAADSSTRSEDGASSDAEVMDDASQSDDDEGRPVQRIEDAIATAIKRGHLGLAYHLAHAAPDASPSANTVKLVACNYVTDEHAPIGAELSGLAAELLEEVETADDDGADHPCRRSHAILTTCAALAPALTVPGGPVAQLLSLLEPRLGDMSSLRALARTAADVSMKGIHLPITLLREEDSLEEWQKRESDLRNKTKTWITNERQSKIRFHAATIVWRRILEEWEHDQRSSLGYMFSLLSPQVEEIDTDRIARISEYWRDYGDKEIDRIDRENRNSALTNRIDGPARLDLRKKVTQALTFSDLWLALIRERPDTRPLFHKKQAGVLRIAVNDHARQALKEIEETKTPVKHGAGELLRRYTVLFKRTDGDTDKPSVNLTDLLYGDLLADPNIIFDKAGQPSDSPLGVDVDVLWDLMTCDAPDFAQAAVERARRGDFLGAEATIDFAQRTGRVDNGSADQSRIVIEEERVRIQENLKVKIKETTDRLDATYAAGALTLETYQQQHDRIPNTDFSETDMFIPLFSLLDQVDKEISDAQEDRGKEIRKLLGDLPNLSQDQRERIELAVKDHRFPIAEDYIERIKRGDELPPLKPRRDRPFDQFFPDFVEKYINDIEGDGITHVRRVVEKREAMGFIDASQLSGDASRDGVGVLDAWITLREGQTSAGALKNLMSAIGFVRAKVRGSDDKTPGGERVFTLEAAPVADRGIARLPDFGSRAGGRYRLFTVRRRATEEAILRETQKRNVAGRSPNIVIFLGALDVGSRRVLAREFGSGEYHPTIVLDEALVIFLAAWPEDRLDAFFDCASAFAFSQPFDPDAAEVPPEMFFGRGDARKAILSTSGDMAHFVYGGRRLGKTALLADIAREYRIKRSKESDEPKELVLLINLKGSGIGENRPTEDLWPLFAEHLTEHRILQPRTVRHESIQKNVIRWLEEKPDRRILLLVDEADAFLDAEHRSKQNYRVLEQIKRLMEETQRRFKVVFAGLHNVQRAARDPNTPFAHLGEAIRIGPMLPETDGDEIQHLIRRPLEALGYRFVSNDSIIRVAAETNYYPALVQQFCKELLKTLREDVDVRGESGPPYQVHPDMVDRVFNARETRDRIRNLFSWTIQLDPRYEFLTYLIARQSFDNEDARPRAVPISDIRDAALNEWREGFASDSSFWMFEVLLEEMVGLGILREASDKKYAVRTRNLRMLLGNDDEIERRFADAKSKMAPAVFDPAQFRNTLGDDTPSSLTANQEYRLLSGRRAVGLVFGTRLAGLDRVRDSLDQAAERWDGSLHVKEVEPATLQHELDRVSRTRQGTHVVLVDMRDAWDPRVVNDALAFVEKRDFQNRIVRPVFLCGPKVAWNWLNEPPLTRKDVELQDIWLGPCARDFIRTWLTEREARAFSSLENPDQPIDLPWPAVAGTAARKKQLKSMNEAIDATLTDDGDNHSVSDVLISESMNTALRLLSTFPDASMTADILSDLSQDGSAHMSPEEVVNFFGWADRLGIIYREEHGYRLDSTYAAGLQRIFEE